MQATLGSLCGLLTWYKASSDVKPHADMLVPRHHNYSHRFGYNTRRYKVLDPGVPVCVTREQANSAVYIANIEIVFVIGAVL